MIRRRFIHAIAMIAMIPMFQAACSSHDVEPPKVSSPDETLVTYTVKGMTCEGCEGHIREELGKLPNVTQVVASHKAEKAWMIVKGELPSKDAVQIAIRAAGENYTLEDDR